MQDNLNKVSDEKTEKNFQEKIDEDVVSEKSALSLEEAKREFGRALAQAFAEKLDEELAQATDVDASVSDDHKRKMNRIFRENAGIENVPYPEVDDSL